MDGNYFVCDTPGFEDTEGNLVDIANSVAISSTIRSCRNVRFILLIEANSILSCRGGEFKKLLQLLGRFISDACENLHSVTIFWQLF
jgi:hypothetical protein